MRSLSVLVLALAAVPLASGCLLYFGDGDDDCYFAEIAPALPLRNPDTGACEAHGGHHWCDGREAPAIGIALPDWGSCYSACEELDEGTCLVTSRCRVAYLQNPFTDGPPAFWGCWSVAPSGPARGGNCSSFDAYQCSRHDDCSAVYTGVVDEPTGPSPEPGHDKAQFTQCIAESVRLCTGSEQCEAGERCTTLDGECLSPPGCDQDGVACPAVCYGRCVPGDVEPDLECAELPDEPTCKARPDCYPVYLGEDCTCDPTGCTCEVLTYDRCQAWG